jgi:hypothetical protein
MPFIAMHRYAAAAPLTTRDSSSPAPFGIQPSTWKASKGTMLQKGQVKKDALTSAAVQGCRHGSVLSD